MDHPEASSELRFPCRHFRNKEMYYQSADEEEDQFSSGIYWCLKTQESFGPDGEPVGKNHCCAGRSCYVS